MSELYELFRRNFPLCIREEQTARDLLHDPRNLVFTHREEGKIIAACVLQEGNILLLCTDHSFRERGIGSALLAQAEAAAKKAGYRRLTVGAGEGYLTPGVPSRKPILLENLAPDAINPALEDHTDFFLHRGYRHAWGCNCFDMQAQWERDPIEPARTIDGVCLRWADASDKEAAVSCARDGHEPFARYYANDALYQKDSRSRVLIACGEDSVLGALIVGFGGEAEDVGSIGCTVVREAHQGRGIASELVKAGAHALQDSGIRKGFLGYTYTGLDRLYGKAGYRISCYYLMAEKEL